MSAPSSNDAFRLVAVAAFLATAAVGWNLGGESKAAAPLAPAPFGSTAKTSVRAERDKGRYGPPDYVRDAMKSIRNAGSTEGRMRATIELAGTLPAADIAAWLDGHWFDTGDGFDLTLFNKILKQRWGQEDPEGLVVWGLKNDSLAATGVLREWATSDPQRLIEFYRKNPNDAMELQSLSEVANSDPALAIGRLQEMIARGIPASASGYDEFLLGNLAAKSPAALEAVLESLPGAWKTKAEMALTGERLKTSFDDEIRKLWARQDGWKLFERFGQLEGVGDHLLGELANLPASWRDSIASNVSRVLSGSNAETWIGADLEGSGFTEEQADRIRIGALQSMGYQKLDRTLELLAGMDLGDSDRRSVISSVFSFARDPVEAERLMELLDSDEDREAARIARVESRPAGFVSVPNVEMPADWLSQAGEIDSRSGASYPLISILENWDKHRIADLTVQFRSMPEEGKRKVATMLSGQGYDGVGLDPVLKAEAIRYLVANPAEQAADGQAGQRSQEDYLASVHAVNWAAKDPVAASEWVQTLPAGDAKLWAQKNLAKNWAQYDPDAAGQWVASLPAAARKEVEGFMKK